MKTAVLALASTLALCAAEYTDRLTRSYPTKPGAKLVFEADYGAVQVVTGTAPTVSLELDRKIEADSKQEADRILQDLEIVQTEAEGALRIQARFREGWKPRSEVRGGRQICRDNSCLEYASQLRQHTYRLTVPRQYNVDLQTRAGSVSVSDLRGSATARTSGGSLSFGRIEGPVSGRTSGGGISLRESSGSADLKTSGGSIAIGGVRGDVNAATSGGSVSVERAEGSVKVQTSGGGINIKEASGPLEARTSGGSVHAVLTRKPSAPCTLTTSGGGVTVAFPPDSAFDLDASTSGGSVSTEFPVAVQGEMKRNEIKTKINGGGPLVTMRASGGSIRLQKSAI